MSWESTHNEEIYNKYILEIAVSCDRNVYPLIGIAQQSDVSQSDFKQKAGIYNKFLPEASFYLQANNLCQLNIPSGKS